MLAYLQARVAERPDDTSAWRMLGVYALQHDDVVNAMDSLERAVSLDPTNAAAHFDLANAQLRDGRHHDAGRHFREVLWLAPESEYAQQAAATLSELPPDAPVVQASYEIKRFDGSNTTSETSESVTAEFLPTPSWVKIDVGAAYNSNVTLAPISRNFGAPADPSAQGFVTPMIEYRWLQQGAWTSGTSFNGYFSLNESQSLQSLNLQSYQPGVFIERFLCCDSTILVPRLQYGFTLDMFDGVRFGDRHATTASLTSLWDRGDTTVIYWTSAYTSFADDGANPTESSRDGWTHATGASHEFPIDRWLLRAVTLGGDLEWADVQGRNYAYLGGALYASACFCLSDTWRAEIGGGAGLRDYYRSQISPSRDEIVWRASAKLTKQFTPHWSLSGVFNYDAFDANNSLFDADRIIAGMMTTFEH